MCGSPSLSCASVGRQKYLEQEVECGNFANWQDGHWSPVHDRRLRPGNGDGQAGQVAPVLDNRDGGAVDVEAGKLLPVGEVVRHSVHLPASSSNHLSACHQAEAHGQAGHGQQGPGHDGSGLTQAWSEETLQCCQAAGEGRLEGPWWSL